MVIPKGNQVNIPELSIRSGWKRIFELKLLGTIFGRVIFSP